MKEHVFTLGIEEEFQIVDPETRDLRSHIQQILDDGKMTLKEHVKPEMHQSMVELGTEMCSTRGGRWWSFARSWRRWRRAAD